MSGSATPVNQYTYPTPVSPNASSVNILAVGPDKSMHEKVQNATQQGVSSSWLDLGVGGIIPSLVAAVSRKPNTIDVVTRGFDGALYHKYKNDSMLWSPAGKDWEYLGGVLETVPEVASWEETRMDVFVIYSDAGLWQRTWDTSTGWHNWSSIGGHWSFDAVPTVVSWVKGRYDVFMMHPDTKELYHRFMDANATNWQPFYGFENLGGYLAGRPCAVSWGIGRLDVFARGGDKGLWHLSWSGDNNTWSNWTKLGDNIQAEPSAVSLGRNRIDVFVWGEDYGYHWKHFDGTNWLPKDGFDSLGADFSGPPKAVAHSGKIDVFGYSGRGTVLRKSWDDGQQAWSPATGFDDWGAPA